MIKVKWKSFKDEMPDNPTEQIWVLYENKIECSCFKIVYKAFGSNYKKCLWAPMEFPEPPEKQLHRCQHDNFEMYCFEENGHLWLNFGNKGQTSVFACPFCGFTLEKK